MIANPVTPLIAGPLADFVLEPAMRDPASRLARLLGPAFGTGPGTGMGVLIAASGLLTVLGILVAWSFPAVRRAEELVPDADNFAAGTAAGPAAVCARVNGTVTNLISVDSLPRIRNHWLAG